MKALVEHDAELSRNTPPAEKLQQALELMETGIAWKRAALEREHPHARAAEIEALLRQWLLGDD